MCTENVIQSNLDGQCDMYKALGVSQAIPTNRNENVSWKWG